MPFRKAGDPNILDDPKITEIAKKYNKVSLNFVKCLLKKNFRQMLKLF